MDWHETYEGLYAYGARGDDEPFMIMTAKVLKGMGVASGWSGSVAHNWPYLWLHNNAIYGGKAGYYIRLSPPIRWNLRGSWVLDCAGIKELDMGDIVKIKSDRIERMNDVHLFAGRTPYKPDTRELVFKHLKPSKRGLKVMDSVEREFENLVPCERIISIDPIAFNRIIKVCRFCTESLLMGDEMQIYSVEGNPGRLCIKGRYVTILLWELLPFTR